MYIVLKHSKSMTIDDLINNVNVTESVLDQSILKKLEGKYLGLFQETAQKHIPLDLGIITPENLICKHSEINFFI